MPTKSWKKHLKKLHTYGSWEVFFLCSPDCPKQPRTSFPFYKFFYPIVSAKVSGYYILSNWRWRFCQFLWPSQKTWTLINWRSIIRIGWKSKNLYFICHGYFSSTYELNSRIVRQKAENIVFWGTIYWF